MAVMYPKFSHAQPFDAARAGSIAQPRPGVWNGWNPGTVLMAVLLLVLAWGLAHALRERQGVEAAQAAWAARLQSSGAADAMLVMSAADAGLLRSLPDRIEGACVRNSYELGRQACLGRLHARGALCLAQVARRYPGQGAQADRTAPIIGAYLDCVFER